MRLADIMGQEHAVGLLTRALATGRLAHACLFDGPDGVGKRSAAIGLALAIACEVAPNEGCGTCDSCRRMLTGQHPDLVQFAPGAATYVVDQAREIVALASSRPHEARGRVIVLDQADALNPASANSLLKTLEEPFPGNYLVLVTAAPDRLLPTIRSRVQRVRFLALRPEVLLALAARRGVDPARAETAAALASGQADRLFALLDRDTEADPWVEAQALRQAARARDIGAIFDAAGAYSDKESRENLSEVLLLIARLYRDAIATAVGADELVLLRDKAEELAGLAAQLSGRGGPARASRAVSTVLEAGAALAGNVNAVTALEKMLMDLRRFEVVSP
jgi:DNA polymerase-3 subunit delta'